MLQQSACFFPCAEEGFCTAQREATVSNVPGCLLAARQGRKVPTGVLRPLKTWPQNTKCWQKEAGREVTVVRPQVNAAHFSNSAGAAGYPSAWQEKKGGMVSGEGEIARGGGVVWQTGRTTCVTKGTAGCAVGGVNVSAVGEDPSWMFKQGAQRGDRAQQLGLGGGVGVGDVLVRHPHFQ